MTPPKIVAFAGSARRDSYNVKVLKVAAEGCVAEGAEIQILDMNQYEMPLFNEDLEKEQGTPKSAQRFKDLLVSANGLLIASPEYNSSVSPLLKNAIDWASRPAEGEPPLAAFQGKAAGILSASPGGLGGIRGLVHLRAILGNIGMTISPATFSLSRAFEAFDEQGQVTDTSQRESIQNVGRAMARLAFQIQQSDS